MTNTTKPALSAAPVAQEPVARLCGYCKTWNSKPCGEQCYLQPSDPVWTSPPATPAGVGVDEIARIIEDNCSVRVQGEYHAPHEGLNEAATAILALLSRGSGSDQQRSHEEQSTQNI